VGPKTESPLANLEAALTDKDDPKCAQLSTESTLPKRMNVRKLSDDPRLVWAITETAKNEENLFAP
jgi:hypothetical protein